MKRTFNVVELSKVVVRIVLGGILIVVVVRLLAVGGVVVELLAHEALILNAGNLLALAALALGLDLVVVLTGLVIVRPTGRGTVALRSVCLLGRLLLLTALNKLALLLVRPARLDDVPELTRASELWAQDAGGGSGQI